MDNLVHLEHVHWQQFKSYEMAIQLPPDGFVQEQ
jgi:hypothetical protein